MADFDWGALLGGALGYAGSQSGNTETSVDRVAPEFQPLAAAVGQRALEIGNMPYNPFPYSMVAGFSPYQFQGMDMIAQQAANNKLPQQAQDALGGVLSGQTRNPYMGANPYLEQNIQNTLGDMTRSYNQNVVPAMDARALKSGSFGNSGLAQAEVESRRALQENLGRTSGNMRMQDYGMQQQLAEADIARRTGAMQTDLMRNSGLYENYLNRGQTGYENAQSRMMQGLGMAPSIYGLNFMPYQQLMGAGGMMQNQAQKTIDAQYKQFQESQNWPFTTFNAMMAPFGRATGGISTTNTPTSPWGPALGGAMMGSDIWKSLFPT
jgi:hypothetical protein